MEINKCKNFILCKNHIHVIINLEDIKKGDFSSSAYDYAKDFDASDEIVIGAPYRDYSFPSLLKAYFEHICVNKLTSAYKSDGEEYLLRKANRLTYIFTAGEK